MIMQISGESTNPNQNEEYALVWHKKRDKSGKSNELKSSIIEYMIQVIHVYN